MKNGGRIPWNATAICETFKISCLMGRHLMRDVLGMPFDGPVIPFGAMVECHPISAKDQSRVHQFGPEVLSGFSSVMSCTGRIWKGDILVADVEGLEQMDASEIYTKRLNAKEVLTPMSGEKFFPNRGWNGKTLWRRSGSENIHLDPGSPRPRGRTRQSSRRIRQTLFSNPISRRLNTGWCGSWKWFLDDFRRIHLSSSRRTQSQTVRAERRIISYATEICQRDQDSKYIVGCIVGEKYPRLLERWWRSRIGRYVDRLHKIHCVGWKTTGWIFVVRGEIDKRTNDLQTRHFVAWDLGGYVWCIEMQRKSKSVLSRNRSSIMLDKCVVFTSLILMMRNSKLSWRMRVESWKFRCQPQMPCKLEREKYRETYRVENDCKIKYACIVEADESTRKHMERSFHKNHEDHIAGKWKIIESQQSCAQIYSYASSYEKYQLQQLHWRKNGKTREIPAWQLTESETKKRWSLKQGIWTKLFMLRR